MAIACLKCGYTRTPADTAPDYECPRCGAVYAKVEAARRKAAPVPITPPPAAGVSSNGASLSSTTPQPATQVSTRRQVFQKWRVGPGKLVAIACVAIFFLAVIKSYEPAGVKDTAHSSRPASPQEQFLSVIENARSRWKNAGNSIQREPMLQQRDSALCNFPLTVAGWNGTVAYIGTYIGGRDASIHVKIASNVTLRTEGDLETRGSKIPRGTPLFNAVAQLSTGQHVTFSGQFIKGERTCLSETSLTQSGGMTEPEFKFIFKSVTPVQ